MKVRILRPSDQELDAEPLLLIILAAVGMAGAGWLLFSIPTPQCLFHAITGLPCPTCGGTRCLRSFLAGEYRIAFEWNPLVFLGALGAASYGLYAAIVTLLRLPRIRIAHVTRAEAHALRIAIVAVVAANWIYLIFRFSRGG